MTYKLYAIHELEHDIWQVTMDHKDCSCRYCVALEVIHEFIE